LIRRQQGTTPFNEHPACFGLTMARCQHERGYTTIRGHFDIDFFGFEKQFDGVRVPTNTCRHQWCLSLDRRTKVDGGVELINQLTGRACQDIPESFHVFSEYAIHNGVCGMFSLAIAERESGSHSREPRLTTVMTVISHDHTDGQGSDQSQFSESLERLPGFCQWVHCQLSTYTCAVARRAQSIRARIHFAVGRATACAQPKLAGPGGPRGC